MDTKFLIRNYLIGILLLLSLYSCKKFVQISPPNTQLVTSDVFNNSATVTSALTGIYTTMFNNYESYYMSYDNGLLSDELTNYSGSTFQIDYYINAMNPSLGPFGCWGNAYNYIYQANAIISALVNSNSMPGNVSNQLVGEAKFIRAFWNFYLTNIYGDVPLVLSTDYTANARAYRTPQAQVYRQVVDDLKEAQSLLSSNYVDASDTTLTTDRVRPNQSVAAAMLSRVYLYMGKYDSAEMESTIVINNPVYNLIRPLTVSNYAFNANNAEAIWQLYTPLPAGFNGATPDGTFYILTSRPSNVSLSASLINSFEPGDQRRNVWVGTYTTSDSPSVTYYYPFKYQVSSQNGNGNVTEYVMVLRLAEQYLIRAEARAQQNDLIGAATDLNVIRSRAGLDSVSGPIVSSQSALLSAILHERRVELFTEWGHRWFDLIRTGNINSVMGSPGNACQSKGGIWNSNNSLYPIPQTEISIDPNLTQNSGY